MIINPKSIFYGKVNSHGEGVLHVARDSEEFDFLSLIRMNRKMNRGLLKGFGYGGAFEVKDRIVFESTGTSTWAQFKVGARRDQ